MKDISWLIEISRRNNVNLSQKQISLFEELRRRILSWNDKVNLISRKEEGSFFENHVLNSISFLFHKSLKYSTRVVDLGTGGGLPGIPVKILRPDLELVLIDSVKKKTEAVADIVRGMGLTGLAVVNGRAEEISRKPEFMHAFDYVITRAAGKLYDVAKWSRYFLKNKEEECLENSYPVGTLLVLKGGEFADEVNRTRQLKFVQYVEVEDIRFAGEEEVRNRDKKIVLVSFKKHNK
jgi:16S rRNA (guanine527-N7)-methyltransferase